MFAAFIRWLVITKTEMCLDLIITLVAHDWSQYLRCGTSICPRLTFLISYIEKWLIGECVGIVSVCLCEWDTEDRRGWNVFVFLWVACKFKNVLFCYSMQIEMKNCFSFSRNTPMRVSSWSIFCQFFNPSCQFPQANFPQGTFYSYFVHKNQSSIGKTAIILGARLKKPWSGFFLAGTNKITTIVGHFSMYLCISYRNKTQHVIFF